VARPGLLGDGVDLLLGVECCLPVVETLEQVHPVIVLHLLLAWLERHTVKDEGPSLVRGPLIVDSVFVSKQFQLFFFNLNQAVQV
jgi:hypothetical protein